MAGKASKVLSIEDYKGISNYLKEILKKRAKMKIDGNILDKAIELYGEENQLNMVNEECIELALATRKLLRENNEETLFNFIDETADVIIMIEQIKKMFNPIFIQSRINYKMDRLAERINYKAEDTKRKLSENE